MTREERAGARPCVGWRDAVAPPDGDPDDEAPLRAVRRDEE
jgi:hypothetical protein